MKEHLLGIDIGGTSIKIGLFTLEGTLLQKHDIPTNKEDHGSHILEDIAKYIKTITPLEKVRGIGFGVPGPVSGDIVFHCVNLGWKQTNVKDVFLKLLPEYPDLIIKVSNDANVASAGELFQGAAKGYKNVCMYTLGTGVGGGIIIDGKVVDGINGAGGEVGHMSVDQKYKIPCNCGKKGCLETVASATGIVALAKIHLQRSFKPSKLRGFKTFSAKKVIDLAKEGDVLCNRVIDEACEYLAYSMSMVSYVINPDLILLGGGVSNAGDFLIKKIEERYYKYVEPFIYHTDFKIASLGNDAGIYGAAYLVKE